MSTYNEEKRALSIAVDSILNQTYPNFQFVIVDDGSEIPVETTINMDNRILLIRLLENVGLTKALNIGLSRCTGDIVIRQDSNDYSDPSRAKITKKFFEEHPDIVMVNSSYTVADRNGNIIEQVHRKSNSSEKIKYDLLGWNYFYPHSGVSFRKMEILSLGGYNERYRYSQDYELYCKCALKYKLDFIEDLLVTYVTDNSPERNKKNKEQRMLAEEIRKNYNEQFQRQIEAKLKKNKE